jgi:hypothetical protein
MKPIVRQILNDRAKAKQVDMMLNPPDVIAGGPGSGRRGGGREREGAGSAYDTIHQKKVKQKREKKQQEQEEATNTLNREKVEQRLDSAGAKRSKLAGMVGKRVKLKDGRRGRIVKDDGGGFGFLEDKRK